MNESPLFPRPERGKRANVVLGRSGSDDHGTVKAFAHALANALQSDKSSLALYPVEIKIGLTKNNHFQRILMASAYPVRWIISLEMELSKDDFHQKKLFSWLLHHFLSIPRGFFLGNQISKPPLLFQLLWSAAIALH